MESSRGGAWARRHSLQDRQPTPVAHHEPRQHPARPRVRAHGRARARSREGAALGEGARAPRSGCRGGEHGRHVRALRGATHGGPRVGLSRARHLGHPRAARRADRRRAHGVDSRAGSRKVHPRRRARARRRCEHGSHARRGRHRPRDRAPRVARAAAPQPRRRRCLQAMPSMPSPSPPPSRSAPRMHRSPLELARLLRIAGRNVARVRLAAFSSVANESAYRVVRTTGDTALTSPDEAMNRPWGGSATLFLNGEHATVRLARRRAKNDAAARRAAPVPDDPARRGAARRRGRRSPPRRRRRRGHER